LHFVFTILCYLHKRSIFSFTSFYNLLSKLLHKGTCTRPKGQCFFYAANIKLSIQRAIGQKLTKLIKSAKIRPFKNCSITLIGHSTAWFAYQRSQAFLAQQEICPPLSKGFATQGVPMVTKTCTLLGIQHCWQAAATKSRLLNLKNLGEVFNGRFSLQHAKFLHGFSFSFLNLTVNEQKLWISKKDGWWITYLIQ